MNERKKKPLEKENHNVGLSASEVGNGGSFEAWTSSIARCLGALSADSGSPFPSSVVDWPAAAGSSGIFVYRKDKIFDFPKVHYLILFLCWSTSVIRVARNFEAHTPQHNPAPNGQELDVTYKIATPRKSKATVHMY